MNTKTATYTIMALVLGYTIMSVVPTMLAPPMLLIENGENTSGDPVLEAPRGDTLGGYSGEDSTLKQDTGTNTVNSQVYYLMLDVIIAFTVYYIARKRFM